MKRARYDPPHRITEILGSRPGRFPGVMPVAVRRKHLRHKGEFLFTPKYDGVRALVLIEDGQYFAVNRCMHTFESGDVDKSLGITILDAELVDQETYYVFDVLYAEGAIVTQWPLLKRLEKVPPGWKIKPFTKDLPKAETAVPVDGVIAVFSEAPYYTPPLKWKPHHTLDLLVRGREVLAEFPEGPRVIHTLEKECDLQGIVEFEIPGWKPIRIRDDKPRPNFSTVVMDTLECVADNVSLIELSPPTMVFRIRRKNPKVVGLYVQEGIAAESPDPGLWQAFEDESVVECVYREGEWRPVKRGVGVDTLMSFTVRI
jgi:hypothetical protein